MAGPTEGKPALETQRLGLQLDLVLHVVEGVEGEVQEVARAAGRVEHGEVAQPFQKRAERVLRPSPLPRRGGLRFRRACPPQAVGDPAYHSLPLGQQGANDHRIDDPHDLVPIRVVRPELRALVGVKAPLEQRAQDRGIDAGPVQSGGRQRRLDLPLVHGGGRHRPRTARR